MTPHLQQRCSVCGLRHPAQVDCPVDRMPQSHGQVIEVRCCCNPERLLGYVRVSGFVELCVGRRVRFLLRPRSGTLRELPPPDTLPQTTLELEFSEVLRNGQTVCRAFKGHEVPLETLRRIVGWVDS